MITISPQQINKELSVYSFSDIETVMVRKILRNAHIRTVRNRLLFNILNRKVNEGVSFWFDTKKVIPDLELLEKLYELNVTEKDRKVNGSYYTPTNIVAYIIRNTLGNLGTVCDPACGSGAFLVESAKFMKNKFNLSYKEIFKNFIFGIDILPVSVKRTKIMLSLLALLDGEDKNFSFNLYEGDSLVFDWKRIPSFEGFDYVVGNPPYVRTKNIRAEVRENIKKWNTANFGNTDLYIPFFEIAMEITNKRGKVGFITPNTYLTSFNAKLVREFLSSNCFLRKIIDFNGWQVFGGATTYTCITILDKNKQEYFEFSLVNTQEKLANLDGLTFNKVKTNSLSGSEWRLLSKVDAEKIFKIENTGSPLFKYVNKFVTGLATLNNDLFLVDDNDGKLLRKEYKGKIFLIERGITKKIIKPNRVKNKVALANNKERIIYPYTYGENGRAKILSELSLKKIFPKTYEYLCAIRNDLKLRDKGGKKYEAWYAYGRTQGLNNFGKKIILPMMDNKPSFIIVEEKDSLIYCGYAIYPKKKEDFPILEKVLNSSVMWFYLKKTSKNYSGGFKSFAKNYVKNFSIPDFSDKEKEKLLKMNDKKQLELFLLRKYQLV
ncbi:MAG: N-6 DNA methylase [Candidatus Moranbacteria bacterium]|nr:N-6 DNA methylase [Candidatus Moranbacteria bacterium]